MKFGLFVLAVVVGCLPFVLACCARPLPPGPVPEPDPTPVPGDPCDLAEQRVCELDCRTETGDALCKGPTGVTFGARCRDELERGTPWHPECVGSETICAELNAAFSGELCDARAP